MQILCSSNSTFIGLEKHIEMILLLYFAEKTVFFHYLYNFLRWLSTYL